MTKSFHKYTGCETDCSECTIIYVTNEKSNKNADYYIEMSDEELNCINNITKFYSYLKPI